MKMYSIDQQWAAVFVTDVMVETRNVLAHWHNIKTVHRNDNQLATVW